MNRLSSALALAATAALLWQSATPAQACYYERDFHPVARSEIILLGTVAGWEQAGGDGGSGSEVKIRIHIDVELTFKGPAVESVDISDARSVDLVNGKYSWDFGVADCGLFAGALAPPVGDRVLIGLGRSDGDWTEVFTFYSRDSAIHGGQAWTSDYEKALTAINDPDYQWGLMGVRPEDIEQIPRDDRSVNQAPAPPPQDVPAGAAERAPVVPIAIAAIALPLLFVLAASFVFPAKGFR